MLSTVLELYTIIYLNISCWAVLCVYMPISLSVLWRVYVLFIIISRGTEHEDSAHPLGCNWGSEMVGESQITLPANVLVMDLTTCSS